jgi:hypothetical protein
VGSVKCVRPPEQDHGPPDHDGYAASNPDVDFKGQRQST